MGAVLKRTKTAQQQIDTQAGICLALTIAVHALLKTHPQRHDAAALLHKNIEGQIASVLASGLSDEVQRGIEKTRDSLLQKMEDPGQPTTST